MTSLILNKSEISQNFIDKTQAIQDSEDEIGEKYRQFVTLSRDSSNVYEKRYAAEAAIQTIPYAFLAPLYATITKHVALTLVHTNSHEPAHHDPRSRPSQTDPCEAAYQLQLSLSDRIPHTLANPPASLASAHARRP